MFSGAQEIPPGKAALAHLQAGGELRHGEEDADSADHGPDGDVSGGGARVTLAARIESEVQAFADQDERRDHAT
jgi:hypothetical protein